MNRNRKFCVVAFAAIILFAGVMLLSCSEVFSPESLTLSADRVAQNTPNFIRVPLTRGVNAVTVSGGLAYTSNGGVGATPEAGAVNQDPGVILDSNDNLFWGWGMTPGGGMAQHPSPEFYGPHWVQIDLGMHMDNISRVEYFPVWQWAQPGGYQEGWANFGDASTGQFGGSASSVNSNGIVTVFEIFLTDTPILPGDEFPMDRRVGFGWWRVLERTANLIIRPDQGDNHRFVATFDSASGRFLTFRMLDGYRNHWAGRLSMVTQVSRLHVYRTDRPFTVDMSGLYESVRRSNAIRSALPANYGFTNAILINYGGHAQRFLENSAGVIQEQIDFYRTNIDHFARLFAQRARPDTFNRFAQKILWADNNGNHVSAHGGGLMWDRHTQRWWWYGESRLNWGTRVGGFDSADWSAMTGGGQPGVHAFSSADLYNWRDEGVAFPIFNNTIFDEPEWRESHSHDPNGFPGGWDGTRFNASGFNRPADNWPAGTTATHGFMWAVNHWRRTLGDWDADGFITPGGEWFPNGRMRNNSPDGSGQNMGDYMIWDPPTLLRGPMPRQAQMDAWAAIRNFIPTRHRDCPTGCCADRELGPPLYLYQDSAARPFARAMGLTAERVRQLNALYRDTPVWRRKQLYRWWNHRTTVERPKVIYNAGTGVHALTGNPITPFRDSTGVFPYVMFTHVEGGVIGIGYGTARVTVSVAQHPAGPFKKLWSYKLPFVEGVWDQTNHMGMTRDQSVFIDSCGTAFHFGSTQENRVLAITMLDETYTRFIGVPRFSVGNSSDELLLEGHDNRLGHNFNWVFGPQREAPAPFVHFITPNMTYEGYVNPDGTLGPLSPLNADGVREDVLYFVASSTSTGWFPNPLGVYRTSRPGGRILGAPYPFNIKPPVGTTNVSANFDAVWGTPNNQPPGGTWQNSTGWITIQGTGGTMTGTASSFMFGAADDGSVITKGFDGQVTHVQQLRFPPYIWDVIGFLDANFVDIDVNVFNTPQLYYGELRRLWDDGIYLRPIFGETSMPEPRAGRLVWGKYIHMADSWDNTKNYDARYIWLPMRVTTTGATVAPHPPNGAAGARARWMQEWRWQDFVYDLGPFANSLMDTPPPVRDSSGGTSPSMWVYSGFPQNLIDYYVMLQDAFGCSMDWYHNPGKQNPGLYYEWLGWLNSFQDRLRP
ncbi:MAG: hypothetical protein FWC97_00075 [Treponema sp.]|nr:hypothetical protein [Treponema sp.]